MLVKTVFISKPLEDCSLGNLRAAFVTRCCGEKMYFVKLGVIYVKINFLAKKNAIGLFLDASGNKNIGATLRIGREIWCLQYAGCSFVQVENDFFGLLNLLNIVFVSLRLH